MLKLGEKIKARREALELTQKKLGETLYVTGQTIAQWENGDTYPTIDKLYNIAKALKMSPVELIEDDELEISNWTLTDEVFSVDRMFTKLLTFAEVEYLEDTQRALYFIRDKYQGKKRKVSRYAKAPVSALIHPLVMACHAHAMGMKDDAVFATALLHDVCEDCDISPRSKELSIFSEEVVEAVYVLTKTRYDEFVRNEAIFNECYYEDLKTNSIAGMVKLIDRCNNVSLMSLAFDIEQIQDYIRETETYVYPLITHLKRNTIEYKDELFLISYQMKTQIETIKALLLKMNVTGDVK